MNKRIIAAILGGAVSVASIPAVAAVVPNEIKGTRYEEAVSVLSALMIMNGDENGEYRLDDTIIRSEAAKMAVTAMGMQNAADSAKGGNDFLDVSAEHWANGYIHVAVSLGLIEGDGDGNFRPNDEITYREAVAIMVRAAGYETSAQAKGGYPKGHLSVASENKMTKSVEGSEDAPITRGNVAVLTNNTLEVNKMEQTGFGSNIRYEVTDETLLSDNLETEKFNGQIKAVGEMTLAGIKAVNDNQIMINDSVYSLAYPAGELLGYNVTAYARKTGSGENEIILAMPVSGKNKTAKLSSDLFVGLTKKGSNDAIEYYAEESASKVTTSVLDSSVQLIYNNRGAEFNTDLINIADKNAYMTMLDTDNDSDFDILFVTEYKNLIVDHVSSNKVTGKDNTVIKFEDMDYRMYQGFNKIEPKELKEWDVLSVAKSLDGNYTEIYVNREVINGKVTSKSESGYVIGGTEYKGAVGLSDTITIGQTADFCIDIGGKIAAVKAVSNVSDAYAYLTNAYKNESGDSVLIKLTDKSGETMTLTLAQRVRVNGSNVNAEEAFGSLKNDGKVVRQLITYKKNANNLVSELNIANDKSESGVADTEHFTLNKKLTNELYNSGTGKLGNIRITDSTVVFDISDINNIAVTDKSAFDNNQTYTGFVYDMSESYSAGVVVLTDTAFKPAADTAIAVVKKLSSGTNSDDENVDILTALYDGKETELMAKDDKTLVKGEGKKLAAGDIIQYKLDSEGNIAGIRVLLDSSQRTTEFNNEYEKDSVAVYGKVTKKFNDSINVSVNDGAAVNYSIGESVPVYSIDNTRNKNNILVSSFDEISVFDEDENNRVFIRIYDDEVKEIVIVK